MRRPLTRLASVALVVLLAAGAAPAEERETAAIAAADAWLALVDAGQYEASWLRSASLLRNAVSTEQWAESVNAARGAFGSFVSREVVSADFQTSLPGAPDGEYVVIRYRATFEKKQAALETVTPMREDSAWKVAGYYIR